MGRLGQVWARLKHDKKGMASLVIIGLLLVVAALGPALSPHDPRAQDFDILQPPQL